MCEQTEVNYRDGEVVWVKLGPLWWPGMVKDVDELPEEILTSLKKKPIAAVKFFQEDTFEYVRNLNQICRYNCRQKKEFIKKGLDMYRAKKREGSKVMDKFPQDVVTAEEITKGDPNILGHSEFAPEERPDYRNIFGSDKKKEDKKGKHLISSSKVRQHRSQPSANGHHSTQIHALVQPRQISSPRFISQVKADSEHEIRIRHQPVSTPTRDPSLTPNPQYKCHICDFTSSRLNVIVLHNKFHSADAANNGQSTPSRTVSSVRGRGVRSAGSTEVKVGASRSRGKGAPTAAAERVRSRSKTAPGTVSDTPKVADVAKEKSIPCKQLLKDEKDKSEEEKSPKSLQVTPKTPEKGMVEKARASVFGKRKGTKSLERAAKKKKDDKQLEKLLADWNDEDEEQAEKEIERIKQEISKRESLSSLPPGTASEEDNTLSTKSVIAEENRKPKDSSCFDFDEADDANLGIELEERAKKFVENRKIPRIIDDKGDSFLRRRKVEELKPVGSEIRAFTEPIKLSEKKSNQEVNADSIKNADIRVTNVDLEDTEKAFKSILEETTVPKLPEIPEVPATTTTIETLAVNDEISDTENCTTSEKNFSNEMVEAKVEEDAPVTSVKDDEETGIASTVPSNLDHCRAETANDETPLDSCEAHCETAEENKFKLLIAGNDHSDSQEISDETVSSTANIVHDEEISTNENLFTASTDDHKELKVEKAETRTEDNKIMKEEENNAIEQSINKEKYEEKCIEETDNFMDTPAMQMECSSVPVASDSIENPELNKPFSAEVAINVISTYENEPEKASGQVELQDENNKTVMESSNETRENVGNIKEEIIVKQESKEIKESLEAEKSEKEQYTPPVVESTETMENVINSEVSEAKLQTEDVPMSIKEKEEMLVKEEEKKLPEPKFEESEQEIKTEEPDSGKDKEVKEEKDNIGLISQKPSSSQMSLEDDEMELDINSMPVVMTDAIITEDPGMNKDTSVSLPLVLQSSPSSQPVVVKDGNTVVTPLSTVLCGTIAVTSTDMKNSVETSQITCSSTNIIKTQPSSVTPVKFQTVASSSTAALSKVKTSSGTTLISQKGGKLVVIQAPGQKSRYTVGKTAQQKVAVKSGTQQQIIQQAVGSGKVVILTKPQGGGQQKILTTALGQQHQRILTTGGKLQTQLQQRIVASTGAILTPVNPRSIVAKGGKLTPVSQQQIKALQGGKSLGAKFTMQSTQAKVILPSMQKAAVTQSSPVRVIGTLKPQSNTILIQTTQGTAMSSPKTVSTAAPVQAKISPSQTVQRPKLLTTAGVQRITLPASGVKTLTQAQPKVVGLRPSVAPRMVVQKVQSPGTVGVLSNISQVRKVSGVFPRTATVQKISQSTTQPTTVQKIQQAQTIHKVIPLPQLGKKTLLQKISDVKPQVSKASEILVSSAAGSLQSSSEPSLTSAQPSMHIAQPTITVASAVPSQPSGIIISPASQSNIITNSTLPVVTTAGAAAASVLTPEQIAHVVAATPSEQVGDGGTPTYVLVTIDDSGALQPYDNSSLLTYDGSSQNEATPRTLYIDPSSIGNSGDLENIILTIDNSATASSTVLNLGQSSTVPVNPATSMALENQNSSVFNIISSSQPADTISTVVSSGGPNQDILAEALANTQVFQPDSSIQDSLTVVNSTPSAVMTSRILEPSSSLHQTTMLLPSLSPVLPPPNPAGVLETSLTLNQPIMTPLEVPSAVTTLQAPPPVPTSLELPLTITQPALSVPSQAFSTLTVPVSTPLACISESESSVSSVSTMPARISITESASVTASACNPSMPLLSEETETQSYTSPNNGSTIGTATISTATGTSSSPQDQITVVYADTSESESTLEKANDTEVFAEKGISKEESYQECDKNDPTVEADLLKTTSDTNKLISDTANDAYQAHNSKTPSSTEEVSPSSNNQISQVIISVDSDTVLLPEQASKESEDASKETNSSLPTNRPEENFSDHYSHTLQLQTEGSVTPVSIPSFDISRNTSSQFEDSEKQTSCVSETINNTESEMTLQSPSYSKERQPLMDDGIKSSDVENPTSLSETIESKSCKEQNPHEDNNIASTSSETVVEHEHSSPSYEYDHIQESNSTTGSEKHSSAPHSMPLLIDEGETESELANNSMEEDKTDVQKTEGLKRSSPYNNDDMSNSSSDMDPAQKRVRLESERSKDQESFIPKFNPSPSKCDDNQKLSDSDDDLPPALPPVTTKKKKFEKDDIVWLKSEKTYWPALVTNVCKKSSKVYVKTVNSPRKQKSFAVSAKRLLDFDNDKRNSELLKLGKQKHPEIEKAYQRVTRFHCKKISGKNISAVRFLTYDADDKFYGTWDDSEPAPTANSLNEDETEQASAASAPRTQYDICKDLLNMEEPEIALTEEERNARNEKAWKLLLKVKSKQCWNHLRLIYKGKVHSIRHELFMTHERQKREYLRSITGMSMFHDYDATKQLLSVLDQYYTKLKKSVGSKDYMYYVMLPEALIFAIQKVDNVNKEAAIRTYNETSGEF